MSEDNNEKKSIVPEVLAAGAAGAGGFWVGGDFGKEAAGKDIGAKILELHNEITREMNLEEMTRKFTTANTRHPELDEIKAMRAQFIENHPKAAELKALEGKAWDMMNFITGSWHAFKEMKPTGKAAVLAGAGAAAVLTGVGVHKFRHRNDKKNAEPSSVTKSDSWQDYETKRRADAQKERGEGGLSA